MGTILVLALIALANTQATVDSATKCAIDLGTATDAFWNTTTEVLNGDYIGAIGKIIETLNDIKTVSTDCKAVQLNDFLMWLDMHITENQSKCLGKVITALTQINAAKTAWNSDAPMSEKLKAWGKVTDLAGQANHFCTGLLQ